MPAAPSSAEEARQRRRRAAVRTELRVFVLTILVLCGIGGLTAQLWWVQVARGKFYTNKIAGRSQIKVRIPSVRGEIRDRNGVVLVQNRASYEVDFYLPDMVRGYKQRSGGDVPQRWYRGTQHGMPKDMHEADIVQIVNN